MSGPRVYTPESGVFTLWVFARARRAFGYGNGAFQFRGGGEISEFLVRGFENRMIEGQLRGATEPVSEKLKKML